MKEHLHVNDLMIGDWVHMEAHRGFKEQNIRVITIPDSTFGMFGGYGHIGAFPKSEDNDFRDVEDRHLFGIQLTDQILEKNGFVFTDQHDWMTDAMEEVWKIEDIKKDYCIELENGEDDYGNEYYVVRASHGANSVEKYVKYVHTFQHILKLLNIDFDIEKL